MVSITATIGKGVGEHYHVEMCADERIIMEEYVKAIDWLPDKGALFLYPVKDMDAVSISCDNVTLVDNLRWTVETTSDGNNNYSL